MSISLSNILGFSSGGFIASIASKEASTIIQLVRSLFAVAPAVVYMHLKGPSTPPPPYLYPPPFTDFPTPTTPTFMKPTITMEIQGPPTTVLPAILISFIIMIVTLAARSYTSPVGPAPRRKIMGRSQAPLPDPAFDFKSIGSPRRIPRRARAPSPSPPPSPPPPPPDPPAMSAPPIKPPPRGFPWLFLLFAVVAAAVGYILGTYREPLQFGLWIDRVFAFFGHGDARGRFAAFLVSIANWLLVVFRSPPWPVDTSLSLLPPSSLSLYIPALSAATCSITSSPLPLPPPWNPLSDALVFGQTMPFYDWVASVDPFGVCSRDHNVVMIPVPAPASYWNLLGVLFIWAAIALRCCIESLNFLRAYIYGLPVLLIPPKTTIPLEYDCHPDLPPDPILPPPSDPPETSILLEDDYQPDLPPDPMLSSTLVPPKAIVPLEDDDDPDLPPDPILSPPDQDNPPVNLPAAPSSPSSPPPPSPSCVLPPLPDSPPPSPALVSSPLVSSPSPLPSSLSVSSSLPSWPSLSSFASRPASPMPTVPESRPSDSVEDHTPRFIYKPAPRYPAPPNLAPSTSANTISLMRAKSVASLITGPETSYKVVVSSSQTTSTPAILPSPSISAPVEAVEVEDDSPRLSAVLVDETAVTSVGPIPSAAIESKTSTTPKSVEPVAFSGASAVNTSIRIPRSVLTTRSSNVPYSRPLKSIISKKTLPVAVAPVINEVSVDPIAKVSEKIPVCIGTRIRGSRSLVPRLAALSTSAPRPAAQILAPPILSETTSNIPLATVTNNVLSSSLPCASVDAPLPIVPQTSLLPILRPTSPMQIDAVPDMAAPCLGSTMNEINPPFSAQETSCSLMVVDPVPVRSRSPVIAKPADVSSPRPMALDAISPPIFAQDTCCLSMVVDPTPAPIESRLPMIAKADSSSSSRDTFSSSAFGFQHSLRPQAPPKPVLQRRDSVLFQSLPDVQLQVVPNDLPFYPWQQHDQRTGHMEIEETQPTSMTLSVDSTSSSAMEITDHQAHCSPIVTVPRISDTDDVRPMRALPSRSPTSVKSSPSPPMMSSFFLPPPNHNWTTPVNPLLPSTGLNFLDEAFMEDEED